MTNFSLEIQIDQLGVQNISSAQMSVALLQPQGTAPYQIVALLTVAAGTTNITWTDSVYVYTSSYSLRAYQTLQINSYVTAAAKQQYTFNGSTISQSGTTSLPDTIQLTNGSNTTVVSGLAKVFSLNGNPQARAITTASSLLVNGQGSFEISNTFILTVLSGAQLGMAIPSQAIPNFPSQNAFVLPQIAAQPPLTLDFNSSNTQTVHFDDQQNVFVVGGLTS